MLTLFDFSYTSLFCFFGIVYTLSLIIIFYLSGIWHSIWIFPLVYFIRDKMQYDFENNIYIINKNCIPFWIFNPDCLITGAIVALVLAVILWFVKNNK